MNSNSIFILAAIFSIIRSSVDLDYKNVSFYLVDSQEVSVSKPTITTPENFNIADLTVEKVEEKIFIEKNPIVKRFQFKENLLYYFISMHVSAENKVGFVSDLKLVINGEEMNLGKLVFAKTEENVDLDNFEGVEESAKYEIFNIENVSTKTMLVFVPKELISREESSLPDHENKNNQQNTKNNNEFKSQLSSVEELSKENEDEEVTPIVQKLDEASKDIQKSGEPTPFEILDTTVEQLETTFVEQANKEQLNAPVADENKEQNTIQQLNAPVADENKEQNIIQQLNATVADENKEQNTIQQLNATVADENKEQNTIQQLNAPVADENKEQNTIQQLNAPVDDENKEQNIIQQLNATVDDENKEQNTIQQLNAPSRSLLKQISNNSPPDAKNTTEEPEEYFSTNEELPSQKSNDANLKKDGTEVNTTENGKTVENDKTNENLKTDKDNLVEIKTSKIFNGDQPPADQPKNENKATPKTEKKYNKMEIALWTVFTICIVLIIISICLWSFK
ncbi:hypothetical protein NGRA_2232 [Nosema granulosis]|uniref:Uncharacterized protein n=1 Tax=Nosema granulosis TaxID=83296 RepID=A0A9P6KYV1_9MICR|nr:hypothetical protein NGRA_2232 [Nosema granulosis]